MFTVTTPDGLEEAICWHSKTTAAVNGGKRKDCRFQKPPLSDLFSIIMTPSRSDYFLYTLYN